MVGNIGGKDDGLAGNVTIIGTKEAWLLTREVSREFVLLLKVIHYVLSYNLTVW